MQISIRLPMIALAILTSNAGRPAQAQDEPPPKLVVATWNVEWMFDDDLSDNRSDLSKQESAPTKEFWRNKLENVAKALAATAADIIALQEIEGDQTLSAIAAELRQKHNANYRYAFIPGSDRFTEQDVGLLFRSGLTQYRRHEQSREMFESNNYYNISKHLIGEFNWKSIASPLTVMTVHLRAMAEQEDLRIRQARLAQYWLKPNIAKGEDVILLGDFNSEHPVGEIAGDMLELTGGSDETDKQKSGLVDLLNFAPAEQRITHLILPRAFDRILVSQSLIDDGPGQDWVFKQIEIRRDLVVRGNQDGQEHWDNRLTMSLDELDTSDHFPLVATFELK